MPNSRSSKPKSLAIISQNNDLSQDLSPAFTLPLEIVGLVFSHLRAADVGRGASACRSFLHAASSEVTAWTLAIAEMDPFCSLGRGTEIGTGAWELWELAGKSWTRVMSALSGKPPSCSRCIGLSSTVFCQCPKRITRAAAASASSASGGFSKKCGDHYSCPGLSRGSCLKIDSPIFNRFIFPTGEVFRTVVANNTNLAESAYALQEAINDAPAFSTIVIKGKFHFADESMFLDMLPVRIVGGESGVKINSQEMPIIVSSPFAIMENISVNMESLYDPGDMCEECGAYHEAEQAVCCPAVQVNEDCAFIGLNCNFNSEMGTAFLMSEGSETSCNALLMDCTLSSDGPQENCGGAICVKENCLLSMYNCSIERSITSIFLGTDPDEAKMSSLKQHNTFDHTLDEDSVEYLAEYDPQIIQPWVNCSWVSRRPP